jgi:hypothetical protein
MSRRRGADDTPLPIQPKKAKPSHKEIQNDLTQESIKRLQVIPDSGAGASRTDSGKTFAEIEFPYSAENRAQYAEAERRMLARYKLNPGKCPICSRPLGKGGVIGHISKCLRTPTSNNGSQKTT